MSRVLWRVVFHAFTERESDDINNRSDSNGWSGKTISQTLANTHA